METDADEVIGDDPDPFLCFCADGDGFDGVVCPLTLVLALDLVGVACGVCFNIDNFISGFCGLGEVKLMVGEATESVGD